MTSLSAPFALPERSRFIALTAAAPLVLLLGHLLPASGPGLALRLAGAAACILVLPGALILRALGWPSAPGVAVAASLVLSVVVLAFGLALVFLLGGSILVAAGVLIAVSAIAAVPAALKGRLQPASRTERSAVFAVLGAAVAYAGVVWFAAGPLQSDGIFHAARARKLADLDALTTLATVGEFKDGGLHPGYAFPLWHAVVALVARLGGVDVVDVMVYLPAVLVPLAFLLAYGAGSAVFASPAGGLALVAIQTAAFGFVRGGANPPGSGIFENLAWPREASVVLLTAALLTLVFAFLREGGRLLLVCVGAAAAAVTAVHPTYTPYIGLVLLGFLAARAVFVRGWEPLLTRTAISLGALFVPFALSLALLLPIAGDVTYVTPSAASRADELRHYGDAFTSLGGWFGLSPDAIARGGPLVVGGLLAIPLAGLATRRLWAALVAGGSFAVLAVVLVPPLFTALADLVTLSQARRLPQFLPLTFALAGACVVVSRLRTVGVALAGAAGLVLAVLSFSSDFEPLGPGWPVWAAAIGGLAMLIAGVIWPSRGPDPSLWSVAAALAFVLPLAVTGLAELEEGRSDDRLTPGIVEALRSDVPAGDVVFSDRRTAYAIAAYAPVYINASTPSHVAETRDNQVQARVRGARRFFTGPSLTDRERQAIIDRWRADWVVVDERRPHPQQFLATLDLVYEDGRFALYRVPRGYDDAP